MKRIAFAALLTLLALGGCKDMKDTTLPPIVGDKTTKAYYKNVKNLREKIPEANRVTFQSEDAAMAAGYHNSQEGSDPSDSQ